MDKFCSTRGKNGANTYGTEFWSKILKGKVDVGDLRIITVWILRKQDVNWIQLAHVNTQ